MLRLFIALSCVSLLVGCKLLSQPTAGPYIQAAVDIAVATAESKGVSNADINRIAKIALAADAGTNATLSSIAGVVNVQIAKLNLPPVEIAGIQILEAALSAAIQAKIGSNPDIAQAQVAIAEVLKDVIAASGG